MKIVEKIRQSFSSRKELLSQLGKKNDVIADLSSFIEVNDLAKRDQAQHFDVTAYRGSGSVNDLRKNKVNFKVLRSFSKSYDVARACINHKKVEVSKLNWCIKAKDGFEDKVTDSQIDQIQGLFENPQGRACNFNDFIQEILEDLFVLDAVAIWKERTRKGDILSLNPIDGGTIKVNLNPNGSIPIPPDVAYVQEIEGKIVAKLTMDELEYSFMNRSTDSPYGLAPLESLIMGVQSALKSQIYNLNLLEEGNVPEGFLKLPKEWSVKDIRGFQKYFDTLLSGNTRQNTKIKMIPDTGANSYIATKKPEDMRYLEFEKWLLIKTCAVFQVQPQDIGFTENSNKAISEEQGNISQSKGIEPVAMFLKRIFDNIIKYDLKYPYLEFRWTNLNKRNELRMSEVHERYVNSGVITRDEAREELGKEPLTDEQREEIMMEIKAKNQIFSNITDEDSEKQENEEQKEEEKQVTKTDLELDELEKWKKKCINSFKKSGKIKDFECHHLKEIDYKYINKRLESVETRKDILDIFSTEIEEKKKEGVINMMLNLKKAINFDENERLIPVRK